MSTAARTAISSKSLMAFTQSPKGSRRGKLACIPSRPSMEASNPRSPDCSTKLFLRESIPSASLAGGISSIRLAANSKSSVRARWVCRRHSSHEQRGQTTARAVGIVRSIRLAAIKASPPLCPLPTSTNILGLGGMVRSSRMSRSKESPMDSPAWFMACHSRSSSPLKNDFSKARDSSQLRMGSAGRAFIMKKQERRWPRQWIPNESS